MEIGKLVEKIKKIKLKNIIYPGITILLFLVLIFVFVWSVRFLYQAINQIFVVEEELVKSKIPQFNIEGFKEIAPKLGIEFIKQGIE